MPTVKKRCAQCQNWQPCPDHQRMYDQRRGHSAARGYRSDPGSRWQRTRRFVLARDPLCTWQEGKRYPGMRVVLTCPRPSMDVAHIIPRSQGGSDAPSNLRGLCHRHHSVETATRESFGRG